MRTVIARIAAPLLCLATIAAVADDAARKPAEIVAEYDSVPAPAYDPAKAKDPEAVRAYRQAMGDAARRKGELALELFRADPDHARVAEALTARWVDTMMSPRTAGETVAEVDRALPHFRDPDRRKTARHMKAIATIVSHRDDPEAAMPEVDRFLADYPKDLAAASLLNGFASSVVDPALRRKLLSRLVAEFPDSPFAEPAERAIAALDLVGKPFELDFEDAVSGTPVSVAGLKGKVVVIDFWATWCGPCVADIPNMKKLHEEFKDRGVAFLAVNLDEGDEGRAKMKAFVADRGVPWPQLCDGKAWDSPVVERLGIRAIPTVVVIDRDGKLAELDAHGRVGEVLSKLLAR